MRPPPVKPLLSLCPVLAAACLAAGAATVAPGAASPAGAALAGPGTALAEVRVAAASGAEAPPPPPVPPPPTDAEAARLAAGEVLLASRPVGSRPLPEEAGRGIIEALPERVFAALIDFAHYQEWVPFVKRSDAQPQADDSVVSFQSLDLPFPLASRHYKIRAWNAVEGRGEAQVWRTWWSYVPGSGNVTDHYGWWVLVPYGAGRTLAACALYTDPGRGVPAWAAHRGTAQTIPYIFSGLRQQIHRSRYDRP
jgi:hypothetical protein